MTKLRALTLSLAAACTSTPPGTPSTATATDTSSSPSTSDPTSSSSTNSTGEPTTTSPTSSSTASTGEPETTTTSTQPLCGDGIVDGAEECDLGPDNANTGACTLECKHATCGDGLVWAGVEECDFGLGNSTAYGGCHPVACTLGPRCGDGILDPEHETCDRGDLNGTGFTPDDHAPCTFTCGYYGRILFLTAQTWTGDLGGVSGGDLKCQAAALAAGLPNPTAYHAWLSDDFQSPATRFEQWDSPVPVILVGGLVVADDLAYLVEFGPRTGISRTELGTPAFTEFIWTNTSAFGETFSITHHCTGWTSASPEHTARFGVNALPDENSPAFQTWKAERAWTSYDSQRCNIFAHIYCIDDGLLLDEED